MPPRPADLIHRKFIGLHVDLLRLSQSEREAVLRMLGQLQSRLLAKMSTQIPLPGFGTYNQQRAMALYRTTDAMIAQTYSQIAVSHDSTLLNVAGFQSQQALAQVNGVIKAPLLTVGLPPEQLKALVNDDLVDGRPARYWWDQQATTLKTRYRDEIRQGAFAGETQAQLKQRIQGTKARNYQDGIMAVTGKQADALIRTSLISVANAARHETFVANDDVLDGEEWSATLDDRTCPICGALDGQAWTFQGDPIGPTEKSYPGPPPQHFNCRCALIPILKSWEDVVRDVGLDEKEGAKIDALGEQIPPNMRESMGGPVAGTMDYKTWLGLQDEATQLDILGKKRFDLWKRDLIDVQDLVDQQNRPLTLAQIQARAHVEAPPPPAPEIEIPVTPTVPIVNEPPPPAQVKRFEMRISTAPIRKVQPNQKAASSVSMRVDYQDGTKAIFKPKSGEEPKLRREIEAGTYYRREAVAYDVAKIMKLTDLVPETTVKTIKGELGSVQAWVPNARTAHELDAIVQYGRSQDDLHRAILFDAVMGNSDRHGGNWMVREADGKIALIDHGLTLPRGPRWLRIGFIEGLKAQRARIPEELKRGWKKNWPKIEKTLKAAGIEPDAIVQARKRLDHILQKTTTWRDLESPR